MQGAQTRGFQGLHPLVCLGILQLDKIKLNMDLLKCHMQEGAHSLTPLFFPKLEQADRLPSPCHSRSSYAATVPRSNHYDIILMFHQLNGDGQSGKCLPCLLILRNLDVGIGAGRLLLCLWTITTLHR